MPANRGLQAKNAAATRWNHPARDDIAREYATERIADYVTSVLSQAPTLTDEQRSRLAELLKPARQAIVAARIAELDGGVACTPATGRLMTKAGREAGQHNSAAATRDTGSGR